MWFQVAPRRAGTSGDRDEIRAEKNTSHVSKSEKGLRQWRDFCIFWRREITSAVCHYGLTDQEFDGRWIGGLFGFYQHGPYLEIKCAAIKGKCHFRRFFDGVAEQYSLASQFAPAYIRPMFHIIPRIALFLATIGMAVSMPLSNQAIASAPANANDNLPWLYQNSDVPVDTSWTFGVLENGLRYAVKDNGVPPGQVSVRVRIDVGSLMERDDERGFAHFLEHLAFRGSS